MSEHDVCILCGEKRQNHEPAFRHYVCRNGIQAMFAAPPSPPAEDPATGAPDAERLEFVTQSEVLRLRAEAAEAELEREREVGREALIMADDQNRLAKELDAENADLRAEVARLREALAASEARETALRERNALLLNTMKRARARLRTRDRFDGDRASSACAILSDALDRLEPRAEAALRPAEENQ